MYQIQNIQCERMCRPLAVTAEHPRFSWELDADENNVYQSAYRIVVEKEGGAVVWDSGKTAGRNTTDILHHGARHLRGEEKRKTGDGRRLKSGIYDL